MTVFSRILCPVDFADDARVLRYAGAMAKWYGARLTVLHAVPEAQVVDILPPLGQAGAVTTGLPPAEPARLREMAAEFVRGEVPGGLEVELLLPGAIDAAREITYEAAALESDLIVMGTHGRRGYERWRDGSVAEFVARASRCPVVVVPPTANHLAAPGDVDFDRVLCAVDFTEGSLDAVRAALRLAEDADALLTLLNVAAPTDADTASHLQHLNQLVPESASLYCRIESVAAKGTPAREILRNAEERRSDLIVMGARTRGALDRLLFGSTSHEVLRAATCPVMIQRGS